MHSYLKTIVSILEDNYHSVLEENIPYAKKVEQIKTVLTAIEVANEHAKEIDNNFVKNLHKLDWRLKPTLIGEIDLDAIDEDQIGPIYRITVLIRAAMKGYTEIVEMLLDAGANPNAKGYGLYSNPTTVSPLLFAAMEGHSDVVRLLLQRGADPKLKLKKKCGDEKVLDHTVLDYVKNNHLVKENIQKLFEAMNHSQQVSSSSSPFTKFGSSSSTPTAQTTQLEEKKAIKVVGSKTSMMSSTY